jgi:CRP/FNR family cyclic AMP-dependent transcriptional regulator
MITDKSVWFFEEVDLYEILCPYKYNDHLKAHPLLNFNKNDFLFMEGDAAREIFLVADGKVKVGFYDQEGNEQVIAFLGKGEILGEMAMFGTPRHREFAQCVANGTKICKLRVEKAQELARDYVPFSLTMTKRIGERAQRLERRLQILLFKDARQRLIEFLKDLCSEIGRPYRDGIKIMLDITQSDIAALIGSSRKTVSLLFTELEDEGIVKFYGRKEIYVADVEHLV